VKNPFDRSSVTFDTPVEMLAACHDRIKDQCATLIKLARHLPENGADAQARQAASNVLRYFDSAGRHHHDDEELDLFPVLLQAARVSSDPEMRPLIDRLLRDHAEMNSAWQALRAKLMRVAAGDRVSISADDAQSFATLYEEHIRREETQLLPKVERLLTREEIASLGRSMSHRRGAR
jgi:hemerythrin-like domain-containing protein